LLTFAFKDEEEVEKYRKEMSFIINQEPIVDKPPENTFKSLKFEIRRKSSNFFFEKKIFISPFDFNFIYRLRPK